MDHTKFFQEAKEAFPKWQSLFYGTIVIIIVCLSLDKSLNTFIANVNVRLLIYVELILIWILFFLHVRNRLPRNKTGIGIVIAIKTENDRQKIRFKNDFIKRMEDLIISNNFSQKINILPLNNFQSEKAIKVILPYARFVNDAIQGKVPQTVPNEVKEWLKLHKQLNGAFYIWGEIKERQNVENSFFFEIDALVVHNPVEKTLHQNILEDINSIWTKRINFLEKIEYFGFQITADIILMSAKYMIGIASLIYGDIKLALEFHKSVEKDLNAFVPIPPRLVPVKNRLNNLLAAENFYYAFKLYLSGNLDIKSYLDESLKYGPDSYSTEMLKAIYEVVKEKDHKKALKTIERAKLHARGDKGWQYSRAFLLLLLNDIPGALKEFDDINLKMDTYEQEIVDSVIFFNENYYRDTKFVPSLYIIGLFSFTKKENYPQSLKFFEQFIAEAKDQKQYELLVNKATEYLSDLKTRMGL